MNDERLIRLAEAPLPTEHGVFDLVVFRWDGPRSHPGLSNEHLALVMGDIAGGEAIPARVHSECLTSEVFGSLKCDCALQLDYAQRELARRGRGVILYLRQEGRGIGLANKVRAYALQAMGADTVEANELLHLPIDAREYDVAAAMLADLGVASIELMTNNPAKIEGLAEHGVRIERRLPVHVPPNPFSQGYLEAKKRRMRHELPSSPVHDEPERDSGVKAKAVND